ncbi:hypothetical protein RchiOBHm_Chr2g0138131 [Rosa chinensis]|uniref:Uncharacterized protein n=1 Tax=Rosa chinensis TaxID=74649 RepID=A0A2P6RWT0_ROSCH|nr:hypothetical protein RchiOBHm_Chr2g0138131 [Rosa chinensis]
MNLLLSSISDEPCRSSVSDEPCRSSVPINHAGPCRSSVSDELKSGQQALLS